MFDYDELTTAERRAINKLKQLALKWPKSLALFSNSGTLEVHKNYNDDIEPYTNSTYIDDINGIRNDGGDRD